jgi:hypothetical protein
MNSGIQRQELRLLPLRAFLAGSDFSDPEELAGYARESGIAVHREAGQPSIATGDAVRLEALMAQRRQERAKERPVRRQHTRQVIHPTPIRELGRGLLDSAKDVMRQTEPHGNHRR